jgi:integrase-like protein
MTVLSVLDAAGRRRSPATLPGYHAGRPPRNKGMRYPADPPTVEEIVAVMRHAADDRHGWRVRAMIVVLWRAGLRIQEALALAEHDLDHRRGSLLVRNGKGGRRREVGMDDWGWEELRPWLTARAELPVGPLFCIIDGPTRGRPWSGAAVRSESAGSPPAPVSGGASRHISCATAHALELAREGVPLNIIQRQLGPPASAPPRRVGGEAPYQPLGCRSPRRRPPNRTCTFPRIRLSTEHAMAVPSQYPLLRRLGVERRGRIHTRPPERLLMLRSCCPPSPCAGLSPARTTTRTPTRPAPISRHRALPRPHQRPGENGTSPTFTMIRLTGLTAGSTPTAHPAGTRSLPPATAPG